MTALASDMSAPDLTAPAVLQSLTDEQFEYVHRLLGIAYADAVIAEAALESAEAALAAERRVLQRIRALAESGGVV